MAFGGGGGGQPPAPPPPPPRTPMMINEQLVRPWSYHITQTQDVFKSNIFERSILRWCILARSSEMINLHEEIFKTKNTSLFINQNDKLISVPNVERSVVKHVSFQCSVQNFDGLFWGCSSRYIYMLCCCFRAPATEEDVFQEFRGQGWALYLESFMYINYMKSFIAKRIISILVNLRYLRFKLPKYKANNKNINKNSYLQKYSFVYNDKGIIRKILFCIIRWCPYFKNVKNGA